MPDVLLQTHHLDLHVQSTEEVLARIEALAPEHRALIWYASGTDLIARRVVSSVVLEER